MINKECKDSYKEVRLALIKALDATGEAEELTRSYFDILMKNQCPNSCRIRENIIKKLDEAIEYIKEVMYAKYDFICSDCLAYIELNNSLYVLRDIRFIICAIEKEEIDRCYLIVLNSEIDAIGYTEVIRNLRRLLAQCVNKD